MRIMEEKKERTRYSETKENTQLWSWGKRGTEIPKSKAFQGELSPTVELLSPLSVGHAPSDKFTLANDAVSGLFMALRRWKLPRKYVILRCLIRGQPEFLTL